MRCCENHLISKKRVCDDLYKSFNDSFDYLFVSKNSKILVFLKKMCQMKCDINRLMFVVNSRFANGMNCIPFSLLAIGICFQVYLRRQNADIFSVQFCLRFFFFV